MSSVKLLKDLNFTQRINEAQAVTDAGKDMLNKYRSYVYSNPVSCTVVNSFVKEAANFGFDTGLTSILESVMEFIGERNISWKLATACESISNNNSNYSYIAKTGVSQVEKLLEQNEQDVVSYIKAGALKGVQYIPEFRNICKEVYKTTICEAQTPQFTLKNPVSYILVEGKAQYFQVNGKTFKFENDSVNEGQCDDKNFLEVNKLLENFSAYEDHIDLTYESLSHDQYIFKMSEENGLQIVKNGQVKESFKDTVSFNEHVNMLTKMMPVNEKMNFLRTAAVVSKVYENYDSICILDCSKFITSANGTVLCITEAKDNVNVTVFKDHNYGTSVKNYDYVIEAIKDVTKRTGIDLKSYYQERITEDCKKENPEESKQIQEELAATKAAQIDIRKKKIAMLAEQYKNDPARITLLNTMARELALLDY
jgi:hypothetical protein